MRLGPPTPEAPVLLDVGEPHGLGIAEHDVEHPVGAGQRPHLGHELIGHTDVDECGKGIAIRLRNPDRGVGGA